MKKKNSAAVRLGRKGGKALAKKMTKAERSESCRKAAEARWAKVKGLKLWQESQKDNCK